MGIFSNPWVEFIFGLIQIYFGLNLLGAFAGPLTLAGPAGKIIGFVFLANGVVHMINIVRKYRSSR